MVTTRPYIRLTRAQRDALSRAAHSAAELDAVIASIRTANPDAFHTPESLAMRVFLDEPRDEIPLRAFMRVFHRMAA